MKRKANIYWSADLSHHDNGTVKQIACCMHSTYVLRIWLMACFISVLNHFIENHAHWANST